MAKFETLEVGGFIPALYGMRHPLKSYGKADSGYFGQGGQVVIGKNDYDLARRLIHAGSPEHAKFLRQICVWVDITAPRYFWSEFDTYKIGTTANSQSTMHRLFRDGVVKEEIDFPWGLNKVLDKVMLEEILAVNAAIEMCKNEGLDTEQGFLAIKALLPEGYMQTRMICLNYQVLRTMYHQRKNHRLPHWNSDFVSWVHTLPYSEFITDEWPIDEKILHLTT